MQYALDSGLCSEPGEVLCYNDSATNSRQRFDTKARMALGQGLQQGMRSVRLGFRPAWRSRYNKPISIDQRAN